MGVDLIKFIKKYSPDSITTSEYSKYAGKTVSIDASIFIYKFCYQGESKCVKGFYDLFYKLILNKINPVLIFDGKPPEIKNITIEKRKKRQEDLENKIKEASEDTATKLKKQIIQFSDNTIDKVKHLCDIMGIKYYVANGEADPLCIQISEYVLSEDYDILLNGGNHMLCKYDYTNEITEINLEKLLNDLKINYEQFVDLCILIGTDYTEKLIKNYGPMTAYKDILNGVKLEDFKIESYNLAKEHILKQHIERNKPESIAKYNINYKPDIKWTVLNEFMIKECNCRKDTVQKHKDKL